MRKMLILALILILLLAGCSSISAEPTLAESYAGFNGTWSQKLEVGSAQLVFDIDAEEYTFMQIGSNYADALFTHGLEANGENSLVDDTAAFELRDNGTLLQYYTNNPDKTYVYIKISDSTDVKTYG